MPILKDSGQPSHIHYILWFSETAGVWNNWIVQLKRLTWTQWAEEPPSALRQLYYRAIIDKHDGNHMGQGQSMCKCQMLSY